MPVAAVCVVMCTGCASGSQPKQDAGKAGASPDAAVADAVADTAPIDAQSVGGPAEAADGEEAAGPRPPLLDRTQQGVFEFVNASSRWFDGFFGSADLNANPEADVSRGLLAVGTRWDERDELDTRVRLRAQFPLPALKERTRLLLGRGDTDDLVDGTETETINTLPEQFSDFTDDDFLLGLGYRERSGLKNGFDFGIGASIRSSQADPYARVTYRWARAYGDRLLWRLRPRVFWQEQRGEGASLNSILDYVLNDGWMLRAWTTLISDQEIEGLGWNADFLAYQILNDRNALSYRAYATGETGQAVELQDYGTEVRYRRRVLREWLFVEFSVGVSWPREFVDEDRDSNLGAGLEVEMQFGDWPGRSQRRPD